MNVINEGLFNKSANHDVCKDFYENADNIIDRIESAFSKVSKGGLINRGKTLDDDKSFNRSIAKARRNIIDAKTRNRSVLNLSVSVLYADLSSNQALALLSTCISGFGFKGMKKYDSALKNFFKSPENIMYRTEKDDSYTVLTASVTHTEQYYTETNLNNIIIKLTNLPDTAKNRRTLNLEHTILKMGDCDIDIAAVDMAFFESEVWPNSYGIFNEATFINETSWDDLENKKKQFWDNHASRMKELNSALDRIKKIKIIAKK